jgi:hypothetical protein
MLLGGAKLGAPAGPLDDLLSVGLEVGGRVTGTTARVGGRVIRELRNGDG